jgi:toxin ParE1/3/4
LTQVRFRIRAAARSDLDAYTDYLIVTAGPNVAQRFVEQARQSFAVIAATPKIGPVLPTRDLRVAGFPKVLIFYIPALTEIRIVRVLHGATDWWSLLDADLPLN